MNEYQYRVYEIKTNTDLIRTLDRELVYGYIEFYLQLDSLNPITIRNVWVDSIDYNHIVSLDKERNDIEKTLTPINKKS